MKEYKNKDTERFNTTGEKYDEEMKDKRYSRQRNSFNDGADRYLYHNKDAAKGLAVHGRGQQSYDEYDYDESSYYDIDDEQWLHDHPIDPRGTLYKRSTIPTFDGGLEYGRMSDFD